MDSKGRNVQPLQRPRSLSAAAGRCEKPERSPRPGQGDGNRKMAPLKSGPKPALPPRPNYVFKRRPGTRTSVRQRPTSVVVEPSTQLQANEQAAKACLEEMGELRLRSRSSSSVLMKGRPHSLPSELCVFIAIDLGTTYSGIAFAIGCTSEKIVAGEKVPTAVLLDKDGQLKAFGKNARLEYSDKEEDEGLEDWYYFDRFKMLLENEKDVRLDTPIRAANGKTMSAKTVFARSLEYFYNQAKTEVPRGTGVPWNDKEVKWVLTVPAIWGDRAKNFMKTAAVEAGLVPSLSSENLEIALEPEAAALCCRGDLQEVWQVMEKPDTLRYIVVDCGGGTVDITVDDLAMDTSQIFEVHRATGGAWGGTEVDKNIADLLRKAMGNPQIDSTTWLNFSRESIEEGKKLDPSMEKGRVTVTLQMMTQLQAAGINLSKASKLVEGITWRKNMNAFSVERHLIEQCYTAPVQSIVDHLQQLKPTVDPVHSILVVGGFAESSLLMKHLEETFTSDRCRVVRPNHPSLSVVKGAVMYAQNPDIIEQRVAQWSYGVEDSVPFNETEHDVSHKYIQDDQAFCRNIFIPFVKEGDKMHIGSKLTNEMSPAIKDQNNMLIKLYRSPHQNVKYTDDVGCELLLQLNISMPRIEKGLDRIVKVTIDVSRTSLHLSALDTSSGQNGDVTYFESN